MKTSEELLLEINALRGEDLGYSLIHLEHVFEGYRARITGEDKNGGCPYSPGSAREISWTMGVNMAGEDHKTFLFEWQKKNSDRLLGKGVGEDGK